MDFVPSVIDEELQQLIAEAKPGSHFEGAEVKSLKGPRLEVQLADGCRFRLTIEIVDRPAD